MLSLATFPHARKMKGCDGLWELRVTSPKGGVRVFYIYAAKNKINKRTL